MKNQEIVLLNGRKFTTRERAHTILKEQFQLDDYYGKNLDALWDLLSEKTVPTVILLVNSEDLERHLGDYGRDLIELLKDLDQEIFTFVQD